LKLAVPAEHRLSERSQARLEDLKDGGPLERKTYLQWAKDRYLPPVVRRLRDFMITEFSAKEPD